MFKIVINFKTYAEGTGKNAVRLSKVLKKYKNVIVCAQASDISNVSKFITTFAQHVDPFPSGAYTGSVSARAVKSAGAKGTLLNHSEYSLPFEVLKSCVNIAKQNNLKIIICAKNAVEVKKVKSLNPDFIAVEPSELIGGKISVTTKPKLIQDSVKNAGSIPLIIGAGIHSREDLIIAKKLGAKGILISSAIVKSKHPENKLSELLK